MAMFISLFAVVFLEFFAESLTETAVTINPSKPVHIKAVGSSIRLNCTVITNSRNITIRWQQNSKVLEDGIQWITSKYSISIVLTIEDLSLENRGQYMCIARDAELSRHYNKTVEVEVGYPPPVPPLLFLDNVYGFPPVKGQLKYTLPSSRKASSPFTVTLLLGKPSRLNFYCMAPLKTGFLVAKEQKEVIQGKYAKTFSLDISSFMKKLFSSRKLSSSAKLCAYLVFQNKFGKTKTKVSDVMFHIIKEVQTGPVKNLKIVQREKNSLYFEWNVPFFMENTSLIGWKYNIECQPDCGKNHQFNEYTNFTLMFLEPYTKYKIFVYSDLFPMNSVSQKTANVTSKTLEDAPLMGPKITNVQWQSSSGKNLTALVIWEYTNDSAILRGNLMYYNVILQPKDAKCVSERVPPHIQLLKIRSLPNANYSITLMACTGGGCANSSITYHLPAFNVKALAKKYENGNYHSNNEVLIAVVIPVVVLIFALLLVYSRIKTQERSDSLPTNVDPATDDTKESSSPQQEPKQNDYSTVNLGYYGSHNCLHEETSPCDRKTSTTEL